MPTPEARCSKLGVTAPLSGTQHESELPRVYFPTCTPGPGLLLGKKFMSGKTNTRQPEGGAAMGGSRRTVQPASIAKTTARRKSTA